MTRHRSPKDVVALDVYRSDEHVGFLTREDTGCRFAYREDFFAAHRDKAGGIAVTLPYSIKEYWVQGDNVPSFFAGLLPEGRRLQSLSENLKTSSDDLFSLLVALGQHTIGDIFVSPKGTHPKPRIAPSIDLNTVDFWHLFEELIEQDSQINIDRAPSIAGIQEKLSASVISFPVELHRQRRPHAEYILKLSPKRYPQLVENEFFFMRLSKETGIDTANVEILHDAKGNSGLLVNRFDRVWSKQKKDFEFIHQEDACQMLGLYPADKCRVSTSKIAEALGVCAAPLIERLELFRRCVFSYLIGNGDMHAKNISIGGPIESLRLTPAYDVLSTAAYGDDRLALKVDAKDKNLHPRDWIHWGQRFGLPETAMNRAIKECASAVDMAIPNFDEIRLDEKRLRKLRSIVEQRVHSMKKH